MKNNQPTWKKQRDYYAITLPNGKVKYVRDRIDFRNKNNAKQNSWSMLREALESITLNSL